MPVALRPAAPLEPVIWPDGSEVAIRRPNLYAAEAWDAVVDAMAKQDAKAARAALVEFVAMLCPSKDAEQIRQECDDEYLFLVSGYANGRLEQAKAFLEELAGKAAGATASPPSEPTGMSPVGSPGPLAVPCAE